MNKIGIYFVFLLAFSSVALAEYPTRQVVIFDDFVTTCNVNLGCLGSDFIWQQTATRAYHYENQNFVTGDRPQGIWVGYDPQNYVLRMESGCLPEMCNLIVGSPLNYETTLYAYKVWEPTQGCCGLTNSNIGDYQTCYSSISTECKKGSYTYAIWSAQSCSSIDRCSCTDKSSLPCGGDDYNSNSNSNINGNSNNNGNGNFNSLLLPTPDLGQVLPKRMFPDMFIVAGIIFLLASVFVSALPKKQAKKQSVIA